MRLNQIWRYPVKGFAGETLSSTSLSTLGLIPGDRKFAITTGHSKSHALLNEGWLAKRHFIQQSTHPALACYRLDFDPETKRVTLFYHQQEILTAEQADYGQICDWLYHQLKPAFKDKPKLVHLEKGGYTDTAAPWISLCTTASLNAFAQATNTQADMRRFRLNLLIKSDQAFEEFSWVGKILHIGDVELEIIEPVGRCSAINAHQDTGEIEADFLSQMPELFGHTDLGVFARVIQPGKINSGDKVVLGHSL